MQCAVIGAGALGSACARALAAGGHAECVTLLSRHNETIDTVAIPRLRHTTLRRADVGIFSSIFVATPPAAYATSSANLADGAPPPPDAVPPALDFLRRWWDSRVTPAPRCVALFTRGLTARGVTPAATLLTSLGGAASTDGGAELPLLIGTGPIMAAEWAAQSTPRSADKSRVDGDAAPSFARAFSGTALSFALYRPSALQERDVGWQDALAQHLQRLLPRESVTLLRGPDAGATLSLVNACLPLCAFGAGLVSNVYAGCTVSALASYAQHACGATEQLVGRLLDAQAGRFGAERCGDRPLPLCALSALYLACTHLGSREFVLGRTLDFHFKQRDAVRAVYAGGAHSSFADTVEGLRTLLAQSKVSNPFYEVLIEAYDTYLRASIVGEYLVKEGVYEYRDELRGGARKLLEHIADIDHAIIQGDETQFDKARAEAARAFRPRC